LLALLQLCDVDPNADERTVGGPGVDCLIPATVWILTNVGTVKFSSTFKIGVHPRLAIKVVKFVHLLVAACAEMPLGVAQPQSVPEGATDMPGILDFGHRFLQLPVGKDETVFRVVDDNPGWKGFENVLQIGARAATVELALLQFSYIEDRTNDIVLPAAGMNTRFPHHAKMLF